MPFMRLIVFDLDHTLLNANSSFRFGSFLYRHKFFSFKTLLGCLSDYIRHKWLGMTIHDLHAQTFARLFEGCLLADIDHYVDIFLTESLNDMLHEPVVQRLKVAQKQGDYILILSSSPDFLVKEIARRLQVMDWKATIYESDQQGVLIAVHVMCGEDKAQYVKKLADQMSLSRSDITVYSDSHLDLPILKMAGQAVAVGPNFYLKRLCLQNGWEIL